MSAKNKTSAPTAHEISQAAFSFVARTFRTGQRAIESTYFTNPVGNRIVSVRVNGDFNKTIKELEKDLVGFKRMSTFKDKKFGTEMVHYVNEAKNHLSIFRHPRTTEGTVRYVFSFYEQAMEIVK